MIKRLLVVLFLLPLFASAQVWTLPSGLVMESFITPSGLEVLVPVLGVLVSKAHADTLSLTDQIKQYIKTFANWYGVSQDDMLAIANCESAGFNPNAYNPKDTDKRPKYGLFQFDTRTWKEASNGESIWDWRAQVKYTAIKMSQEGYRAWPWCGKHKEQFK